MEKVNLPKEVAEAIEQVWSKYNRTGFTKHMVLTNWSLLSERHTDQYSELRDYAYSYPVKYMQSLVNGYEVEQTPEEKARDYILDTKKVSTESYYAIKHVLSLLNIKLKGVN